MAYPLSTELREMGVDFHEIIIWIELISDKATIDGITPKEAITKIVQDLKLYTQFTTLEQAIKHAQQNLDAINIAIDQRRQAIASLVDLHRKGISDTELNSFIVGEDGIKSKTIMARHILAIMVLALMPLTI